MSMLYGCSLFAALTSGLLGGLFFAFSNFVMRALARLPAAQGLSAMQSINVTVVNPLFGLLLLAMGGAAFVVAVSALLHAPAPARGWLLAGSACLLLGSMLVTFACNVPRNDALSVLDPTLPASGAYWREFLASWTGWNHVRTVGSLLAALFYTLGLLQLPR